MDLRTHLTDKALFEEGIALIQRGDLWYQPFILADGVEVGEGQNLEDQYRDCKSLFDNNVYLSETYRHYWNGNRRKLASDGEYFHRCNSKYRENYCMLSDIVIARMGGDISGMSFLELGCNTGLNLFNLATRGAGSCMGVDWTKHGPVFDWLNRVLGTNVVFRQGFYDNLWHAIPGVEVPEADVVLNTVFLNHQCDPIQVLCYLGDRARKGLFLWVLLEDRGDDLTVTYAPVAGVHDIGAGRQLPLSFHNNVRISTALLKDCLKQLGFGEIEFIPYPRIENITKSLQGFQMVWARRTDDQRSAFWSRGEPGAHSADGREILRAARTYYVRADGNDDNTGLTNSAGGAFRSIQRAANAILALDTGSVDVTIQIARGVHAGGIGIVGPRTGSGLIIFKGDAATPSNVVINATHGDCFAFSESGQIVVKDMELRTTGAGNGLSSSNHSDISFENIRFGACVDNHLMVRDGGSITATGDYEIVGDAQRHISCYDAGSSVKINGRTITLTGPRHFSINNIEAGTEAVVQLIGNTYRGTATGPRFYVSRNAIIRTAGREQDYLPGDGCGAAVHGGRYM